MIQELMNAARAIVAGPSAAPARRYTSTLGSPAAWLFEAFGGSMTDAGETVTTSKALSVPAIFTAVRIITETIASMPCDVFEVKPDGRKMRVATHPASYLFSIEANPNTTWPMLCDAWLTWKLLWGDGMLRTMRDGNSQPVELRVLPTDVTEPKKHETTGELIYEMNGPGGVTRLARRNVIHLPGFSFDGIRGHSAIWLMRESIGEMLGTRKYARRFWGNSARPGGYIQHPKALNSQAIRNIREGWEGMHRGAENAHRIAVLEEGAEFKPTSLPPEDAQFLETRKLQNADVARIFRVPLHMLQEMDRATFSNIEHQALEFLTNTLMPIVHKAEAAMNQRLFAPYERGRFIVKFNPAHVLRADAKTRGDFYQKMRHSGVYSADMILEMEGQNPLPGGRGSTVWMPTNMMPAPTPDQAELMLAKYAKPKAEDKPADDGKDDDQGKDKPEDKPADDDQGAGKDGTDAED